MSARDKATKRMGNAQIGRKEARVVCPRNAEGMKRESKREMRKARRVLDAAELREGLDYSTEYAAAFLGRDPVDFEARAEKCVFAIHGALQLGTGGMAEALRYLKAWTDAALASPAAPAETAPAHLTVAEAAALSAQIDRLRSALSSASATEAALRGERDEACEALRGMLLSADCEWENRRQGHDWAEACTAGRAVLARIRKETPDHE